MWGCVVYCLCGFTYSFCYFSARPRHGNGISDPKLEDNNLLCLGGGSSLVIFYWTLSSSTLFQRVLCMSHWTSIFTPPSVMKSSGKTSSYDKPWSYGTENNVLHKKLFRYMLGMLVGTSIVDPYVFGPPGPGSIICTNPDFSIIKQK